MRLCFWNVQNLFEVGVVDRGPQSDQEVASKVARIGQVLSATFPNELPDVIGLAEVETQQLAESIEASLAASYELLWAPAGSGSTPTTGLGLLYRTELFNAGLIVDEHRPTAGSRPRVLVTELELANAEGTKVVVAVNHWKSRMPHAGSPLSPEEDRNESAGWLADLLQGYERTQYIVVLGDFNADPWEPAFNDFNLRSRRTPWTGGSTVHLYNTSWRFAGEPDLWETKQAQGRNYREPRPKRTHESSNALFDQLMVSPAVLRGGELSLREGSVGYHTTPPAGVHSATGILKPHRWRYDATTGSGQGAGDHFPIVAELPHQD